jgi:triosephosphate isomerase
VNAKNAGDLIQKPNIDGFLVGSASLKQDFLTIIETASKQAGSA